MCYLGKFQGPLVVNTLARNVTGTVECVHPFCQIMKVLTILIPFQSIVSNFAGLAFIQLFANPQASLGRMQTCLFIIKATEPATLPTVGAVFPQGMMNLVDQL